MSPLEEENLEDNSQDEDEDPTEVITAIDKAIERIAQVQQTHIDIISNMK